MHANLPGTPTEYRNVVARPRGDVPANPEAIVQARRLLTDSLPKIEMPNRDNFADLPDWKRGMQRLPGYPF